MLFDQDIIIPETLMIDGLSVKLMNERARYNLRLKSGDVTAFKKATGLALPRKVNTSSTKMDTTCLCLGPDEWVVIADKKLKPKLDKLLAKASKDFVCSVTDISHRNVGFEISGPESARLINVGCPLDFSLEKFPVGKATRTVFESVSIMLLRTGEDSFHVECWRSFGPYLRDYFKRVVTS